MASKEGTPAASDAQSSAAAKKEEKPLFTPKEQNLMTIAMMHCLKSGPPEIDYTKFMKYGEFNTMKTAQNTWGRIRAKLKDAAGPTQEDPDDDDAAPKTPKAKATPKKRGSAKKAAAAAAEEDADESPAKKVKKEDAVAGAAEEMEEGEFEE